MKIGHGLLVVSLVASAAALGTSCAVDASPKEPDETILMATRGSMLGVPEPSAAQMAALTSKAQAGDVKAMNELGLRVVREGGPVFYGRPWDRPREAEMWWKKAAGLGDIRAMNLLGHMYAEPWGVPQNLETAAGWFSQAAAKGSVDAVKSLAQLYLGEWSYESDDAKAVYWLRRAADMGDVNSMVRLGLMYDAGLHVAADSVQGPPLVSQGHRDSQISKLRRCS